MENDILEKYLEEASKNLVEIFTNMSREDALRVLKDMGEIDNGN